MSRDISCSGTVLLLPLSLQMYHFHVIDIEAGHKLHRYLYLFFVFLISSKFVTHSVSEEEMYNHFAGCRSLKFLIVGVGR